MRKTPPATPIAPGSIRADELLLTREACRRLEWERKTLAHAKREGLKTIRFGRFDYCRGADVLRFFDRLAEQQAGQGGATP
jgi:hypothetical protein